MSETKQRIFKCRADYPYILAHDDAEFQEMVTDSEGNHTTRTVKCVVLRNGEGYDITTALPKEEFENATYFDQTLQKDVPVFREVTDGDKKYA